MLAVETSSQVSSFISQLVVNQLGAFSRLPNMVGIGISLQAAGDNGGYIVSNVYSGMSADNSGAINVGDVLVEVETLPVKDVPLETIRRMMIGPRGTLVSLALSRSARVYTVCLRRGSYSGAHCVVSHDDREREGPVDYNSIDLQPHFPSHSSAAAASGALLLDIPGVSRDTVAKLLGAGCALYLMPVLPLARLPASASPTNPTKIDVQSKPQVPLNFPPNVESGKVSVNSASEANLSTPVKKSHALANQVQRPFVPRVRYFAVLLFDSAMRPALFSLDSFFHFMPSSRFFLCSRQCPPATPLSTLPAPAFSARFSTATNAPTLSNPPCTPRQ